MKAALDLQKQRISNGTEYVNIPVSAPVAVQLNVPQQEFASIASD